MSEGADGADQAGTESKEEPPSWGLGDAVAGFLFGLVLATIGVALARAGQHLPSTGHGGAGGARGPDTFATVVANLVGLWIGLAGSAVLATRLKGSGRLSSDFGWRLRPWPDVPLGIAAGLGSQLLLLPLLYLPLQGFVPRLDQRLGQPARQLTGGSNGFGLVVVAILVTLGAALVEELFFRGLLQRSLDRRLRLAGERLGPLLSVVLTALAFGLAHAQSLQLLGLFAFGLVLGWLARSTGRLGPGIVAHTTFNAVAVVSILLGS